MINRSPSWMIFTADLHYCTTVLQCPTRLILTSTSFIKICLHIKFTMIYGFAFSAFECNTVKLSTVFTCCLETRDISRWKQTKDGCRKLIIIKEWKIIDLCIWSAFCYHHVTACYHFLLLKSSQHTLYFLNCGFINSFTHTPLQWFFSFYYLKHVWGLFLVPAE